MERVLLPHLSEHPLTLGLFTDVKNAAFLREQLLQGNTAFEYAFLDASVLASRTQVLAACFRAINDTVAERMKSRNVHSEIVFSLSPNNNIAESFRRFGVAETTTDIVAIKVGGDSKSVGEHLTSSIDGELHLLTDDALALLRNDARLKKIYQVDLSKDVKKPVSSTSQAIVLGNMALKGS